MRFKNKVAAVTGGGSGIGHEVAKRFVAEGGKVFINGRDETKLKTAAADIDASGANVGIYPGDIAQPTVGRELVEALFGSSTHRNNAQSIERSTHHMAVWLTLSWRLP
jgi:NAD(P)-dependent dehydrogenase (short-subunit alcohol dehydrogenase family)